MAGKIQPLLTALERLNNNKSKKGKQDKSPSTKDNVKTLMSYLYNAEQSLDKAVEEMFRLAGRCSALLSNIL